MGSDALVTVDKEGGQDAATIQYENVAKMWSRCWGPSRKNAVWLINQDAETELNSMTLPIGTGGVAPFLPASGISGLPYSTLFGRPIVPCEHCQTLGTTGDIVLADFSQYVLAEHTRGLQSASSIHVRFLYNETAFRFTLRADGQSAWASALTPKNGSNTLSPFVALQTRS